MELGLKGKVALVTGAGSGIGRATALALAEEGCRLVICDINPDSLEKTAAEIRAKGGEVLAHKADVTCMEHTDELVATAVATFGGIDILVNNAGTGRLSDLMQLPEEEFRRNMDLMLYGLIRLSKTVAPHMRKNRWGRIVNLSSVFGKQPGGLLDYDAIKAAVIMVTKDFANYLAKDNVTVNAVCPGPIRTPLWEGPGHLGDQLGGLMGKPAQEAIQAFADANIPMGRFGLPDEIAHTIVFLSSDAASFITGQAINVDGGMVKATL